MTPDSDVTHTMAGRTVLVTGGTGGIGKATAIGLAKLGARVAITGRELTRTQQAAAEIGRESGNPAVDAFAADLSCQAEVRRLATDVLAAYPRLDVLVNNVGGFWAHRHVTADGLERTFALNHLAPFLLTNLLIPLLEESAPARIINVSSGGMYTQKLRVDDLQSERGQFDGPKVYARTKRAEVILTELWAEQLAGTGVVVHSMHPGWSDTPGVRSSLPRFYKLTRPLLRTPAQGADTIVWLGAAAEPGRSSGRFWHDRRPRPSHRLRCTRETRQERERLLAEFVRLSGWHDASVPTAATSIPEGES